MKFLKKIYTSGAGNGIVCVALQYTQCIPGNATAFHYVFDHGSLTSSR